MAAIGESEGPLWVGYGLLRDARVGVQARGGIGQPPGQLQSSGKRNTWLLERRVYNQRQTFIAAAVIASECMYPRGHLASDLLPLLQACPLSTAYQESQCSMI
jgi:hypothetical protein